MIHRRFRRVTGRASVYIDTTDMRAIEDSLG
jgi:hypothetical protein